MRTSSVRVPSSVFHVFARTWRAPAERNARTALWRDDYFLCAGCDQLYWRGTHWDRIAQALAASA